MLRSWSEDVPRRPCSVISNGCSGESARRSTSGGKRISRHVGEPATERARGRCRGTAPRAVNDPARRCGSSCLAAMGEGSPQEPLESWRNDRMIETRGPARSQALVRPPDRGHGRACRGTAVRHHVRRDVVDHRGVA